MELRTEPDGPDATIVAEIYDSCQASEDARAELDNGNVWIETMTNTLERLATTCAG
jgi:hypothetical protein